MNPLHRKLECGSHISKADLKIAYPKNSQKGDVHRESSLLKHAFKDPFRHIEILSQMRARSVAAHSEKSVLFRPHAEI